MLATACSGKWKVICTTQENSVVVPETEPVKFKKKLKIRKTPQRSKKEQAVVVLSHPLDTETFKDGIDVPMKIVNDDGLFTSTPEFFSPSIFVCQNCRYVSVNVTQCNRCNGKVFTDSTPTSKTLVPSENLSEFCKVCGFSPLKDSCERCKEQKNALELWEKASQKRSWSLRKSRYPQKKRKIHFPQVQTDLLSSELSE